MPAQSSRLAWSLLAPSALGTLCVAATDNGLVFLASVAPIPTTSPHFESKDAIVSPPHELLSALKAWKLNEDSLVHVSLPCQTEHQDNPDASSLDLATLHLQSAATRLKRYADCVHSSEQPTPTSQKNADLDITTNQSIDWDFLETHDSSRLKMNVWRVIAAIPLGEIWDYSRVAKEAGCPKAVRAVASAVGSNFVPLVVPCHRVVGKDGKMRGFSFRGGLDIKRELLKMETGRVFALLRLLFLTILFLLLAFPPHSKLDLIAVKTYNQHFNNKRPLANPTPLSDSPDGLLIAESPIPNLILRTFKTRDIFTTTDAAQQPQHPPVKPTSHISPQTKSWYTTWQHLNPTHLQLIFTDAQMDAFVSTHFSQRVVSAYYELPLLVQRCDFARYLMLFEFGGVYADMDTQAVVPVREWGHVVGVGVGGGWFGFGKAGRGRRPVEMVLGVEEFGVIDGLDQLTQWTIASAPSHPFLHFFLLSLTTHIETPPPHVLHGIDAVTGLTGPAFWSKQFWIYVRERYPYFDVGVLQGLERGRRVVDDVLVLGQVFWRYPGVYVKHWGAGEGKEGWKKVRGDAIGARNRSREGFGGVGGGEVQGPVRYGREIKAYALIPPRFVHVEIHRVRRGEGDGSDELPAVAVERVGFFSTRQQRLLALHELDLALHDSWETMNPGFLTLDLLLHDLMPYFKGSFTMRVNRALAKLSNLATPHSTVNPQGGITPTTATPPLIAFARLLMLYQLGGYVVLDSSVECPRSIREWGSSHASTVSADGEVGLVLGVGNDNELYSRVIAASPKHEFVGDLVSRIVDAVLLGSAWRRVGGGHAGEWEEIFAKAYSEAAVQVLRGQGVQGVKVLEQIKSGGADSNLVVGEF
ncbi:hypothetical protein HDU98_001616 [Podochytrium sp. JEL0797]|nr:hypothetical protein HDU98_001616 [Podochytrium sp. JEL0797]